MKHSLTDITDTFPEMYENLINGYLEIGNGWADIVYELSEKLAETGEDVRVAQVKEKFGELRFYTDGDLSIETHDLINEYCKKAINICEVCGAPGEIYNLSGGWYGTRCDNHK